MRKFIIKNRRKRKYVKKSYLSDISIYKSAAVSLFPAFFIIVAAFTAFIFLPSQFSLNLNKISYPSFTLPQIKLPAVKLPQVKLPEISLTIDLRPYTAAATQTITQTAKIAQDSGVQGAANLSRISQKADPRPYFPGIQKSILTFRQNIVTLFQNFVTVLTKNSNSAVKAVQTTLSGTISLLSVILNAAAKFTINTYTTVVQLVLAWNKGVFRVVNVVLQIFYQVVIHVITKIKISLLTTVNVISAFFVNLRNFLFWAFSGISQIVKGLYVVIVKATTALYNQSISEMHQSDIAINNYVDRLMAKIQAPFIKFGTFVSPFGPPFAKAAQSLQTTLIRSFSLVSNIVHNTFILNSKNS